MVEYALAAPKKKSHILSPFQTGYIDEFMKPLLHTASLSVDLSQDSDISNALAMILYACRTEHIGAENHNYTDTRSERYQ